jgi:hypothetical protein
MRKSGCYSAWPITMLDSLVKKMEKRKNPKTERLAPSEGEGD